MKNNKKLVVLAGAAALGLVAATGVTSGFAWFTANTSVTATGMALTAKSDAIFLEIKGTEDANYTNTGTNNLDAELEPVAHESWSALADITDFDLHEAGTYDNWYHMQADSPDAAASTGSKNYITSFTGYVATTTFDVKVHQGSGTGYDLYVSSVTFSAANAGLRLIVAGADGYQEFSSTNTSIAFNASNIISDEVTTTEQTITAYLYIDGNDSNVYTANKANLTGSVSFGLTAFNEDHI